MKKKVFGILILLLVIAGVIFTLNFEAVENAIFEKGKIEERKEGRNANTK